MQSELACFNQACRARYDITAVLYNCPKCGGLLEAVYDFGSLDAGALKKTWRERRMSNAPLEQSGVWRYRELFPFIEDHRHIVTLREGNTPLLSAAARRGVRRSRARLRSSIRALIPRGRSKTTA